MVRFRICAIIAASVGFALSCCYVALAATADDLYRAQTIVTGQGETNRLVGFAICLEDVLIKVSGALKLAGDFAWISTSRTRKSSLRRTTIATRRRAGRRATSKAPATGPSI